MIYVRIVRNDDLDRAWRARDPRGHVVCVWLNSAINHSEGTLRMPKKVLRLEREFVVLKCTEGERTTRYAAVGSSLSVERGLSIIRSPYLFTISN